LTYTVLVRLFPGKTELVESVEEPARTGDEQIDALLAEGETAVFEMRWLREAISDDNVKANVNDIIDITDSIFKKLLVEQGVYKQVKRFADYFLPTTIKLLNAYDRFGQSGIEGDNITGTMNRIDKALDTTLDSYKKFYDSLFEDQALDIETDITVLEAMLKQDGFLEKDF